MFEHLKALALGLVGGAGAGWMPGAVAVGSFGPPRGQAPARGMIGGRAKGYVVSHGRLIRAERKRMSKRDEHRDSWGLAKFLNSPMFSGPDFGKQIAWEKAAARRRAARHRALAT